MNRRGQLFLIEVIIALSVLVVLISTLFTIQSFTPPPDDQSLRENGEAAIESLIQSELIYEYFDDANHSYYSLGERIFDSLNQTKLDVIQTIDGSIPAIAGFKANTYRYNDTQGAWTLIDIVNFESSPPSGSDQTNVEYYCPGYDGNFVQFRFTLQLWYEVGA